VFHGTGLREQQRHWKCGAFRFKSTSRFSSTTRHHLRPSLSFIVDKRNKYYFNPIIRGRIGVTSQTAEYTTVFLDWSLERIGYEPINAQIGALYFDSLSIDRRPQFNSIISGTLQRDKRNDAFYPSGGFFHSITFERGRDHSFRIRRPVRDRSAIFEIRQARRSRQLVLGSVRSPGCYSCIASLWRLFRFCTEILQPLFRSPAGSSEEEAASVRGWRARELSASRFPEEGGNTVFESECGRAMEPSQERRKELGFIELNKFSLVFFYDVGNVGQR